MRMFLDARTKLVFETGLARGVPSHVSKAAHRMMHLLRAASGWQDLSVVGQVGRIRGTKGRFGLRVEGKWHVTFAWDDDFGVYGMGLERR